MDFAGLISGIGGGLLGGLGALGGKWLDLKAEAEKRETLRVQNAHALALREKDLEQTKLEAESQLKLHQVDADASVAVADFGALTSSTAADRATYGDSTTGRIVDLVRGLTRPLITFASMGLVIYMTAQAFASVGWKLPPEQATQLLHAGEFTASAAILWWFGARPSKPRK